VAAVLVVAESGVVEEVQISSGNATLAQSAATALAHWRYTPFKADGQSAMVKVPVTVSFRLAKAAN
jgi:outer membrane biosynthesis protein TonB